MRIRFLDGKTEICVDSKEELWLLKQVLRRGDLVKGFGKRTIKYGKHAERIRTWFKLKAEKIKLNGKLKISGKIIEAGHEDIQLGKFQSLKLDEGDCIIIYRELSGDEISTLKKFARKFKAILACLSKRKLIVAEYDGRLRIVYDGKPDLKKLEAYRGLPILIGLKDVELKLDWALTCKVSAGGLAGLRELLMKGIASLRRKIREFEEKKILDEFFSKLKEGKAEYGIEQVGQKLKEGRVEKLIIDEKILEKLGWMIDECLKFGGEFFIIRILKKEFDAYKVGAILRY